MLHVDPHNPAAKALEGRLRDALGPWRDPEVDLVLGGDGFMLQTLSDLRDRTYLGLNAGRIGFLMNDTDAWDRVIDRLARRAWTVYGFPTLHAEFTLQDGRVTTRTAVNDIAVERSSGQTAHLALSVDDRLVVDRLVADGVVVSTALGSTAYTFSAGGPAAHPGLALIALTAIAPHHPRLSPFLLPETATIQVTTHDTHRRPVRLVADGQSTDGVTAVTITLTPNRVRLAWLEGHDFTARMISKILRP